MSEPAPKAPMGRGLVDSLAPLLVVVVFTVLMHAVIGPRVGFYYSKILMDIGINIILAVSLNIVNGFTGQFSIGHASFMAVGGYTAGTVTYYGGAHLFGDTMSHGDWRGQALFLASCVAGAIVAGLFGVLVGLPSLRLKGDYLALVTLGFGEIIRVLLQQTHGVPTKVEDIVAMPLWSMATDDHGELAVTGVPISLGGSLGFTGLPFYTNMAWVYAWVCITLIVAYRLKESTHGRALLSIREDEIAAEAMGIPTTKLKIRAFVMSAALAGIAGALFAHEIGTTLNPKELGFQKSFEVVIMVVLGGMGSISGVVLAAIVLTVLPELLRDANAYRMILYALSLILMMILRPQGLFGLREVWELPRVRKLMGRK